MGSFDITHGDLTLTVFGHYRSGIPASALAPAEPASFEIVNVWLGTVDITKWLADFAPTVIPEIEGRLS